MLADSRPWDLFLSHADTDLAPATELYKILSPLHRVFLDMRCLLPGDEWDLAIARAQRAARITVVLVSAKYEAAYYLREEIATAIHLARQDPEGHRVVPVFLDGWPEKGSSVPYGLRLKQAIDAQAVGGIMGVAERLRPLLALPQGLSSQVPLPPAPQVHDRIELYELLCRLLPAQFAEVLFRLKAAANYVSPGAAPQSTRAIDLILLLEQEGDSGLAHLAAAIQAVSGGNVRGTG